MFPSFESYAQNELDEGSLLLTKPIPIKNLQYIMAKINTVIANEASEDGIRKLLIIKIRNF